MTAKNEISEELKELSGVVAGIRRSLPYEGPDAAYFENLPTQLLLQVREASEIGGDSSLSPVLQGIKNSTSFSVPEGYFDNFASRMLDKLKAETVQEWDEVSPLLQRIGKKMPFSVPEDYFGTLSVPVVLEQAIPISPSSELADSILSGIVKSEVYQVPAGYFDNLAGSILSRVQTTESAKVIAMPARTTRTKWLKYTSMSVAASVLLVIGWLSLHISGASKAKPETNNADISSNLTKVSDQDIQNYLEVQHPGLDEELANSTAALDISASDLYSMLDQVSDAELKEYMEDHGNLKDLPTN